MNIRQNERVVETFPDCQLLLSYRDTQMERSCHVLTAPLRTPRADLANTDMFCLNNSIFLLAIVHAALVVRARIKEFGNRCGSLVAVTSIEMLGVSIIVENWNRACRTSSRRLATFSPRADNR